MGKTYVIRAFARKCKMLLYLRVWDETGITGFIAKNVRSRQVEKIPLSTTATADILAEIRAKSNRSNRYGYALQTISVSNATKNFISACWSELKNLRPQLCIE